MRNLKKLFGVALGCLVCQCSAATIDTVESYHSLVTEKAYLARLSMLRQMESTQDWVKDRQGRFNESIAVYISKVLGDLVGSRGAFEGTNMYNQHARADGIENKRGQVLEIAVDLKERSGANWNALLFKNYLAGSYWDHFFLGDEYGKDALFSELGVDLVAEVLRDKYRNEFNDEIDKASSDVKKYLKALDLYRFLQEMDSTQEKYKSEKDEIAPFAVGDIKFNNDKEKNGLIKHASFEITAFVENDGKKEAKRLLGCIDNGKFIGYQIEDNIGKDGKPFANDAFVQLDGYMRVIDQKVSIANAAFENINAIEYDSFWDELMTIAQIEGYSINDIDAELENGLSTTDYKLVLGNGVNLDGEELGFFNEKFPLLFDRFRRAEGLEKYKDEQAIADAFLGFVQTEHKRFFETKEDSDLFKRVWRSIRFGSIGIEKKESALARDVKKNGDAVSENEMYGGFYRIVIDNSGFVDTDRNTSEKRKKILQKVFRSGVMDAFAVYKREKGVNPELISDEIFHDFLSFLEKKVENESEVERVNPVTKKIVKSKPTQGALSAVRGFTRMGGRIKFVAVDPLWDKVANYEADMNIVQDENAYKFGNYHLIIDTGAINSKAPSALLDSAVLLVNNEYLSALKDFGSNVPADLFTSTSEASMSFNQYLTEGRVDEQKRRNEDGMATALELVKKLNIKCRFVEDKLVVERRLSDSQSSINKDELLARSLESVSSNNSFEDEKNVLPFGDENDNNFSLWSNS